VEFTGWTPVIGIWFPVTGRSFDGSPNLNQISGVNVASVELYPAIGTLEGQWPVAQSSGDSQ
jgi:hypothetical protein